MIEGIKSVPSVCVSGPFVSTLTAEQTDTLDQFYILDCWRGREQAEEASMLRHFHYTLKISWWIIWLSQVRTNNSTCVSDREGCGGVKLTKTSDINCGGDFFIICTGLNRIASLLIFYYIMVSYNYKVVCVTLKVRNVRSDLFFLFFFLVWWHF